MTTSDPWENLRRFTPARIAQGRAGASLPTSELLKFELDHARAQDAVQQNFDADALAAETRKSTGLEVIVTSTLAKSRAEYLRRPDLGRTIDPACLARLLKLKSDLADKPGSKAFDVGFDVGVILSDGLSAQAVDHHGASLAGLVVSGMKKAGLEIAPIVIVPFGRVASQDQIGQALKVKLSIILIGERPGLLSPDSLGAYLVYNPTPGRTDGERNCVSNIRPQGLPLQAASDTILYLVKNALIKKLTGVGLKDDRLLGPKAEASVLEA